MARRALLSVFDKTGLTELARGLLKHGYSLISTGGTYKTLKAAGIEVEDIPRLTGWPEMLGGRVKTLHPKIHGGILALRNDPDHMKAVEKHKIDVIDLVVVNLYPFRETASKPGATRDEVVEMIDIGGPAMVRSAAKNHDHVAVVVDPSDYKCILEEIGKAEGAISEATRRALAIKAFSYTAAYDTAVAAWLGRAEVTAEAFPVIFSVSGEKVMDLRYGENPHQKGAFYRRTDTPAPSLAAAHNLGGKELSYNNLLDLDAAWAIVQEFGVPACAVVKHTNPCGGALGETPALAFSRALACDPAAAFGSVVGFNRPLDAEAAELMGKEGNFVEAVVAPSFTGDALKLLRSAKWGKNVRLLQTGGPESMERLFWQIRPVSGGFLLQTPDAPITKDPGVKPVTQRKPTDEEMRDLMFAWRMVKHVKSNAILLARGGATVGVGAGQMSRVDAAEIAVKKAGERAKGAVLASDAFFPFADGLEVAVRGGVTAVIQPGGSKRDNEVIAAADKAGIAMVLTGERHFRH